MFLLDGKAGYCDAVDCFFFVSRPAPVRSGAGFGRRLLAIRRFQRDHRWVGPVIGGRSELMSNHINCINSIREFRALLSHAKRVSLLSGGAGWSCFGDAMALNSFKNGGDLGIS
jgi:hypothetical protein